MTETDIATGPTLSKGPYGATLITGEAATRICTLGHELIDARGQELEMVHVNKNMDGEWDGEVTYVPTFGRLRTFYLRKARIITACRELDEAIGGIIPANASLMITYGTHDTVEVCTE